ncbi:ABC transporter permease subunit [Tautonia plasticadhaerens]|uniref:ABC-2 family transporter protein n=1 Tax=Tautonia plasticadhaerens TaxID=2527974 RepID=A0A518HB64_9BACT|nr:ABC transporter permease subunit [Tautonia plasticadhaerens]QDV37956.1 ABC-2 family transporter protein [Tautonia plasticadhaerens]
MSRRLGLGPVFEFEWLTGSRRWQSYAMRSLTVSLLLGVMVLISMEDDSAFTGEATIQQQAQLGRAYFATTATILLGLVGLAAPAATAGAVCLDKARGNLTLLFATDLSDREIVLGKLAARLVPVLGMILCASPVLAIATLFGGVDPVGLTGTLLVILACAAFGCSLAMTLSIWGRKTHEVLMATYVFGILYLLLAPLSAVLPRSLPAGWWPSWLPTFYELLRFNPVYLVLSMIEQPSPGMPPVTFATQSAFFGLGLGASALLIALATWRIRAVVIRQLGRGEGTARPRRRSRASKPSRGIDPDRLGPRARRLLALYRGARRIWPAPSLDRNPVLWRECQRKRLSALNLLVWGTYVLLCGGFSLWAIALMLDDGRRLSNGGREIGIVVNTLQVAGGLLMLSVSSATSLAEERQRGSLDVLLATPLPTRSIVWGKWWGSFRGVGPLLILPVAVSIGLARFQGHYWAVAVLAASILSQGAAITSLGLALATWVPRLGRAVGLAVGLYVAACIGWIPLALILFGEGPGSEGQGVAAASPLFGVGSYSQLMSYQGGWDPDLYGQTLWMLFWTVFYGGVSFALLLATFATFNRCLGRVDEPTLYDEDDYLPADLPPAPSPAGPAPAGLIGREP